MEQNNQNQHGANQRLIGRKLQQQLSRFCAAYADLCQQNRRGISPAIACCNEQYDQKITLEALSRLTRLNKSYLSQLFHKEMSLPFR